MATIRKISYKHAGGEVVTKLMYGKPDRKSKSKSFYIPLPEDMRKWDGRSYLHASSEDAVVPMFQLLCKEFLNAATTVEKMILLTMDMSEYKAGKQPEKHRYESNFVYFDDEDGYPEQKLEMKYSIVWIFTIGDKKLLSRTEDGENKIDMLFYEKSKLIPWTAEREKWISNTYDGFRKLIAHCKTFYSKNENQIINMIETKTNLLNN